MIPYRTYRRSTGTISSHHGKQIFHEHGIEVRGSCNTRNVRSSHPYECSRTTVVNSEMGEIESSKKRKQFDNLIDAEIMKIRARKNRYKLQHSFSASNNLLGSRKTKTFTNVQSQSLPCVIKARSLDHVREVREKICYSSSSNDEKDLESDVLSIVAAIGLTKPW